MQIIGKCCINEFGYAEERPKRIDLSSSSSYRPKIRTGLTPSRSTDSVEEIGNMELLVHVALLGKFIKCIKCNPIIADGALGSHHIIVISYIAEV